MSTLKKLIAVLLALVMAVSALPVSALAAELSSSDEAAEETNTAEAVVSGDYRYTILSDGTASICGYGGTSADGAVCIPEAIDGYPVSELADEAFAYASEIERILIPESVTRIGNAAFFHCEALTLLAFQGSSLTFGLTAFEGCHMLERILLSSEADTAALSCLLANDLGKAAADSIHIEAFDSADALSEAFAPPVNTAAAYAEADTPDTAADNIADGTCGSSLTWTLSSSGKLTIAGTGAMSNYSARTAPWYEYRSQTTTLEIGSGVTSIGSYAFYGCSDMKGELVIPDSVTSIGTYAFYSCSGFTGTLVIPDSLTALDKGVFSYMRGVTSLVIGENVSNIYTTYDSQRNYEPAFFNMSGVTQITFTGLTPPSGSSPFRGMTGLTTIFVPANAYSDYANVYNAYLPATVRLKSIGAVDVFQIDGSVLTAYSGDGGSVIVPDGVTSIAASAFQNCALTDITLPDSLTEIGSYAFSGCTSLSSISFPDSLKTIGSYAFYKCTALSGKITFPVSLESIGDHAFYQCASLTGSLTIPDSVTALGAYAFYQCTGLDGSLTIGSGVKQIEYSAFYQCRNLSGLTLGSSVTSIGSYAFYGCSGMKGDLVIPDSVTSISAYAFQDCSGFTGTLYLSQKLTSLGKRAFYSCSGFTGTLVIPDSLTALDEAVFSYMRGVTSLVIGENVSNIYTTYDSQRNHEPAFFNMSGVTQITFTGLTPPNGSSPFRGMTGLTTIFVPVDAYSDYVSAYSSYAKNGINFSTDTLTAKIYNLKTTWCGSRSVTLTWDPHPCSSIIGYRIQRDGVLVGTTDDCTFTDRYLISGRTYTYTVYGYTAEETATTSATLSATPQLPVIDCIRTDNSQNTLGYDQTTVYIHVQDNQNLRPSGEQQTRAALYYLDNGQRRLIGQATLDESLSSSHTAVYTVRWDVTQMTEGNYTVVFCLTDADGATGEYLQTLTVDNSRPARIVGVAAISDAAAVHLTWAISAEADTSIYRIYRRAETEDGFRLITQLRDRNTLSYVDEAIQADCIYYYYVTCVSALGRESEPSLTVGATLSPDTEAPVVTRLSPANGSYLTGTVSIGLTAQDNVSVTCAELYYSADMGKSWTLLGSASAARFSKTLDTTLLEDGVLMLKGIARDAAGNESAALTYTCYVDNTGPEQIHGLAWEATSVTATLSWRDVSDDDIRYYRVERRNSDGSYSTVSDTYSTLGLNIYHLTPDTEYTYRVVGYDLHGNRGIPSEPVVITTASDTAAPVVTQLRPTSGYYAECIDIRITAEDEYNVASLTLQASQDAVVWTDIFTNNYTGVSRSRTMEYTLSLDSFKEGPLFVRGIATDTAGNRSDTSRTAPYVQHIVDKTPPNPPEHVTATGYCGYNEIRWTQGSESDLGTYTVYRSTAENDGYTLLSSGLKTINCIDRSAETGTTYYYRVTVDDLAGNVSDASAAVSAASIPDTEAPQIISIYPQGGSAIGSGYRTVSVLAGDNQALASVLLEYSRNGSPFVKLLNSSDLDAARQTVAADIPLGQCADGDTITVRASAQDRSGNSSEPVTAQLTVDLTAPAVLSASAVYQDESVQIAWTGGGETDLIGYRLYRKAAGSSTYSLIAQRQAVSGQSDYTCCDYDLAPEKISYLYRIEAVDACGNTASVETAPVSLPDRSTPVPVLSCETTQEVGVEYYIDASASTDNSSIVSWHMDFGDGSSSEQKRAAHAYEAVGVYTVTLTVTDDDGNRAACTREITVRERSLVGTAKIRITDENGSAVSGAPVYFDLGADTQVIKTTDRDGCVSFTAEVGKHTVGCVIPDNQWLPVKKDIIITAGEETSISMTMVHQVMIEGAFEITRMTFEEIAAAGIDVSAPENQYMVTVRVTLTYGQEEVETSFTYNQTTGQTLAKPTIVSTPDGERRQIIPVALNIGRSSINHSLSGGGGTYRPSSEVAVAYLDVPVGVSSLKEFFHVNLHIINNAAQEFSIRDNVVTLNLPKGLTIVDTYQSQSSAIAKIAEIRGQTTETITWIIRGDEVGEYCLSADYSGILSQFNEPISAQFRADAPIQVYGLSNLKLRIEIPFELDHGTFYYNTSLTNEGRVKVYRPELDTGDTLIGTQLFSETGANISDQYTLDAERIEKLGLATNIDGALDTLLPGYRLTRYYMCLDQTMYTDLEQKLQEYAFDMQNSYGLAVEIVKLPLSYFKSTLSADINPVEKADLLSGKNQSALEYLTTNENYIYCSMHASTGEVSTALTSREQKALWELLAIAAGNGDFKSLFGIDDKEHAEAILLDAMELNLEAQDYSKYYAICDWTKAVAEWAGEKGEGYGKLAGIAANWVKDKGGELTEEKLKELGDRIGKSLSRTFELIAAEYRWEFYRVVYEGDYLDMDKMILTKWQFVYEETYQESIEIFAETDRSVMLHELFSAEGFSKIWKSIGFSLKAAEHIVKAAEKTSADISLYFMAYSNMKSCDLFLETLCRYVSSSSNEASAIAATAKELREKINQLDVTARLSENIADETFWAGLGYAKKAAVKKLDLTPNAYIQALKLSLKLTQYVGNNVFNVSERHEIADTIRFASYISYALSTGVLNELRTYQNGNEESAWRCMQLISYLLNIRALGEAQVAAFGITYEVLPGIFDSRELFYAVRDMSGAADATTWIEWRNFVEDRISMLRVQLLKNPVSVQAGSTTAPIVTFNYAEGRTAQTFSSEYEYSLDGGMWITCGGSAIPVVQKDYARTLQVRRIDHSSSTEKLTASVTIYAAPSLQDSGICVRQTADGYRVEGLEHSHNYEVTFSSEPISYPYGTALEHTIPSGSYTYEYTTENVYGYAYIRSVADASRFASYVLCVPVYPMATLSVDIGKYGYVAGTGRYEYGAEATLVATPSDGCSFLGWYEGTSLLSREPVLNLTMTADRHLSARFQHWMLETDEALATGFDAGLTVEDLTACYQAMGYTTVSLTDADGQPVNTVATGCNLTLDGASYMVVVRGDTNGDGSVSVLDMACLYTYLTGNVNGGKVSHEVCFLRAVDVNNDGSVNVYDLQRLYEAASGIRPFA